MAQKAYINTIHGSMSRVLYNIADSDIIETETAMDVQKVAFFLHDYLCLAKWKEDDNCLTVICESNNTARFNPDEFIKDFKASMEDPEVNVRAEWHENTRHQIEVDFYFSREEK